MGLRRVEPKHFPITGRRLQCLGRRTLGAGISGAHREVARRDQRPIRRHFSNNIIEPFRDQAGLFQDFKSLLKPNATMAHASPCYAYNYSATRFHTLFRLGRSPHVLAERTGFRVESVTTDGLILHHVFRSL